MPIMLNVNASHAAHPMSSIPVSHEVKSGQVTGATISPLVGPSSHSKQGVSYAPFASMDIMNMAMGHNLAKAREGKQLFPLICRNDQDKIALEKFKINLAIEYYKDVKLCNNLLQQFEHEKITLDQARNMFGSEKIDTMISSRNEFKFMVDVLARTDIKSNDDCELNRLQPEEHKLYILGHGAAGVNILAADESCKQGMVNAADVAQQLREGGLSKEFYDFRVASCFSADTRVPTSFHHKDLQEARQPDLAQTGIFGLFGRTVVKSEPFSQTLSNELKLAGFEAPSVAGYHGAGRMLAGEQQSRRLEDSDGNYKVEVRSSTVRHRFTPNIRV